MLLFLAVLSSMLVFSLMLSDVDGKTYEYGMLRALGFKKNYLVSMISISAFTFSVPGCTFGVLTGIIMNVGLREVIFLQAQNYMSYSISLWATILGLVFGLLMPMMANYLPIKVVMG